jgi:hypothetical protein
MQKRISLLVGIGLSAIAFAQPKLAHSNQEYAKTLFRRLSGSPILLNDPRLEQMTNLVSNGDYAGAAAIAVADQNFYEVTVRSWAAKMSNVDQSPLQGLNDMQATLIGTVRDELDARLLLVGNYRYEAFDDLTGLDPVSPANNNHYAQFDQAGFGLARNLKRASPQWRHISETAGVLTSRAWAEAHMKAGTNRRALEYTFKIFLCTPIQTWRDPGLPDFYVRRDVDRRPGGNPATYQKECRTCHAGMDALAGAYARFNFEDNTIQYAGTRRVFPKFNNNGHIYPDGFVTSDDAWFNMATRNHNVAFGWRGEVHGKGLKAFAKMVADSKGFSQCMTKRVFSQVCSREAGANDHDTVVALADAFEDQGYNLKNLFKNVATNQSCISHEPTI